jgi:MFS family permease
MPLPTREQARTTDSTPRVALSVWLLGAGFYAYGFAQRVAPSVMIDELMSDFTVTARTVGGVSASFLYAYAILQIPLGVLLDRWGTRRVFLWAAVLCVLGSSLFATSQHILLAHLGRILLGAGSGVAWVGTLKLIAHWFPVHRFALLSGAALTFGMIGAVAGQAPLSALVSTVGWRGSMVIGAAGAAAFVLLLSRLPDEDVRAPGSETTLAKGSVLRGLRRVLSHRQTWYAASYGSLMTVPMLGFATLWGVPYLIERFGVTRPTAGLATSLLLVGWGLGAPLYGWWSGRTGHRRRLMVIGATINLTSILLVLYLPGLPFPAIMVLLFLNGLGSGSMPLCFSLARSHQPPELAASAFGFANTLVIALAAAVQPLIGLIMDLTWGGVVRGTTRHYEIFSYQIGLIVIPASVAAALVLALLLREPTTPATEPV